MIPLAVLAAVPVVCVDSACGFTLWTGRVPVVALGVPVAAGFAELGGCLGAWAFMYQRFARISA